MFTCFGFHWSHIYCFAYIYFFFSKKKKINIGIPGSHIHVILGTLSCRDIGYPCRAYGTILSMINVHTIYHKYKLMIKVTHCCSSLFSYHSCVINTLKNAIVWRSHTLSVNGCPNQTVFSVCAYVYTRLDFSRFFSSPKI